MVHVLPAWGELPAQLILPIESGRPGRNLRIHVYFLPQVDDPPVLQYFVTLPYQLHHEAMPSLARLICTLNASLPLTGTEMSEPNHVVDSTWLPPLTDWMKTRSTPRALTVGSPSSPRNLIEHMFAFRITR